jgi:hypothetical protein
MDDILALIRDALAFDADDNGRVSIDDAMTSIRQILTEESNGH